MDFSYTTKDAVASFSVKEKKSGDVTFYTFDISFREKIVPSELCITTLLDMREADGFWTPLHSEDTEVRPEWNIRYAASRLANGLPLMCVFRADGSSVFTLALSDVVTPSAIGCGTVEETGEARMNIRLFTAPVSPRKDYSVTLRIDRSGLSFADAVKRAATWWEEAGMQPCPVPEEAKTPVYSTWYNFHYDMSPKKVTDELKIAYSLGFRSVIIDSGWMCSDNEKGAPRAGDWEPAENKVGNGADFVCDCHKIGMKVLFWFPVSFMGRKAKNHARFEGKYLYTNDTVSILDPRYPDVREFVISSAASILQNFDLDGMKLDFADMFVLKKDSPESGEGMDIPVLEDAVLALMSELYRTLSSVRPNVLLEFRQPYVGPAIRGFGNMFRVSDCPYSGRTNGRASADLRLTSGRTAVHTDMTMWDKGTSTKDAARQLWLGLFAVPQISVLLKDIPEEHYKVVRRFLGYWNENRDILLEGEFDCPAPFGIYSYLSSFLSGKEIRLLITEKSAVMKHDRMDIVNATGSDSVYLDLTEKSGDFRVTVTDRFGNVVSESVLPGGSVSKLALPDTGVAGIVRA